MLSVPFGLFMLCAIQCVRAWQPAPNEAGFQKGMVILFFVVALVCMVLIAIGSGGGSLKLN